MFEGKKCQFRACNECSMGLENEKIWPWFMEFFYLLFLSPSICTSSLFLCLSITLTVVSEHIYHSNVIPVSPRPLRLSCITDKVSRLNNRITIMAKERLHYLHGNMSWEQKPLVWYCTWSCSSLLLRGWEFRPLCSLGNRGVKALPLFVCKPSGDLI